MATIKINTQSSDPFEGARPVDEEPPELTCPLTGEVVSVDDVDGLIDLYERIDAMDRQLWNVKRAVRESLAGLTEGEAKTRRVRGHRRAAKVVMPDDSWDQATLREAWTSYPQYREEALRIATFAPRLREWKKMVNTSGPPEFEAFRDLVGRANRGPVGAPTIKVEL